MNHAAREHAPLTLSKLQRQFINQFQGNFPLQQRPFRQIAEQLNRTEDELVDTVQQLAAENILTRFGPLYDADALEGGLTLAAMSVPEERYATVTAMVNRFPQVAHNYRREHQLNMWFVVATETLAEIKQVLQSIENTTGLTVYNFPKQQEFYIGLWLKLHSDGSVNTIPVQSCVTKTNNRNQADAIDKNLIRATQTGLPITKTPYQSIAQNTGLSEQETLQRLERMLKSGIIRRIGAVPNHYRLGLAANGMTVWDVDDSKITELGNTIGQLDFVSHCYQRPRHQPAWPYNLFAMVHGHNKTEVNDKVKQIETLLGGNCRGHETLFSSAILKKTGLRLAA